MQEIQKIKGHERGPQDKTWDCSTRDFSTCKDTAEQDRRLKDRTRYRNIRHETAV